MNHDQYYVNDVIEPFGVGCAKDYLLQKSFGFSNGFLFHTPLASPYS